MTLVKLGEIGRPSVMTLLGVLVAVWLLKRKSSLAFLVAIVAVTIVALVAGLGEAAGAGF